MCECVDKVKISCVRLVMLSCHATIASVNLAFVTASAGLVSSNTC
jgi:hypothetical protein